MVTVADDPGSIPGGATDFLFYSPEFPDRLWGPPSLMYELSRTLKRPGSEIVPSSSRRLSALLFGLGQLF